MAFDLIAWKEELLFTGRIVQDGDSSVTPEEAHRRFLRYVELVEQLDGSEGSDVIAALFQSIQMKDDYGAYQTMYRIMARFPDQQFIDKLVAELPSLIKRQSDWAGDFLVGLANGKNTKWDYLIGMFNDAVAKASSEIRRPIVEYVRSQEPSGWFRKRVGVLCPEIGSEI
jgi:hypothetical protein